MSSNTRLLLVFLIGLQRYRIKKIKNRMISKSIVYPSAWIVDPKDKGRKKVYPNNKIYLEDGSEFAIELYNPTQNSILAELKINGQLASSTGLILRPGERFYLDCFIDDKKKFIYRTYEVDSTSSEVKKAIENNGYIQVNFYREKYIKQPSFNRGSFGQPINNGLNFDQNYQNINCFYSNTSTLSCSGLQSLDFLESKKSINLNETGRVEKGSESEQKFVSVDMPFEDYTLCVSSYQILPESKRPITTKEVSKETINFCPQCGQRVSNSNDKFCRNCGNKLN